MEYEKNDAFKTKIDERENWNFSANNANWGTKTTKNQWLNARYDRIAKNITRKYCIYGDYLLRQLGIQYGEQCLNWPFYR